jgi:hypothetical protein
MGASVTVVSCEQDHYIAYLEAKLAEMEAQRQLLLASIHHKEAMLRRLRSQLIMHNIAY